MINYTDPLLQKMPMLAVDFGTWTDNVTWTVDLRTGVSFHDGTPFNADAVKWNVDRLIWFLNYTGEVPDTEIESGTKSLYCLADGSTPIINSTTVVDSDTITFHLNEPFAPFLDIMTYVSAWFLSPTSTPQYQHIETDTGDLVGTGPFVYDEYVSDVEVRWHRNDDYRLGPAYFERLVFAVIEQESARNAAMLTHDIDVCLGESEQLLPIFRADDTITVNDTGENFGIDYLGMNNKVINVTYRKAISYALDYDYIIDELMQGQAVRAHSFLSSLWDLPINQSTEMGGADYNVTHARRVLVEAGCAPGLTYNLGTPAEDAAWAAATLATFNYSYNTDNQFRVDLYPVLRDNLDAIGIVVTDGPLDWATYIYRAYGYAEPGGFDQLQLYWVGWGPDYMNPWNMLDPLVNPNSLSNSAQVNDTIVVNLLIDAVLEDNVTEQKDIFVDVITRLATVVYSHCWGFHGLITEVYSADLRDYPGNAINDFWAYPIYRV
jgi:peptide/nickel transport system substrate-binding protein